jgi:hypothetical protein
LLASSSSKFCKRPYKYWFQLNKSHTSTPWNKQKMYTCSTFLVAQNSDSCRIFPRTNFLCNFCNSLPNRKEFNKSLIEHKYVLLITNISVSFYLLTN